MTKSQKVWINIFIIFVGYLVPTTILKIIGSDNKHIYKIQIVVLLIIFVAGFFLAYLNNKNRKIFSESKSWFILFETLGILSILYAIVPLYFIFAFRNGINF